MRTVIMAAGQAKRWNANFPKMIAPFKGKPNLLHNLDLFGPCDLTTPPNVSFSYPGIKTCISGKNDREIQRFLNAFPLTGPTLFLYGDVFYDPIDAKTILETESQGNTYFGWHQNDRTGKPHRELLAVKVNNVDSFVSAIQRVMFYFETGVLTREIGWEVYEFDRAAEFVTLSDRSDDYDDYEQYKNILKTL